MQVHFNLPGWEIAGESEFLGWLQNEWNFEGGEGDIYIVIIGHEEMKRMHQHFLNKTGTTDVLAFDLMQSRTEMDLDFPEPEEDPSDTDWIRGEVYVNLEQAIVQAKDYNNPIEEEAGRLALHGMLHLAGWMDNDDALREKMGKRENEGLSRAGTDQDKMPWRIITSQSQGGNK
ncbi:MAG: rRNA maturation RNase YbeY [Candidatus Electryonea clarkiae]|nr:rRNA maturation RNase YbeY [Candidatus Electryonea clarkiae]MDP8289155.1 rRNA maturation RNase YbeY [Candidatus Electryonea clarkiae]